MEEITVKIRCLASIVVLLLVLVCAWVYNQAQGPIEGSAGIAQLNGSTTEYIAGRAISNGLFGKCITGGGMAMLMIIWIPYSIRSFKDMLKAGNEKDQKTEN